MPKDSFLAFASQGIGEHINRSMVSDPPQADRSVGARTKVAGAQQLTFEKFARSGCGYLAERFDDAWS
jgi:hypothetical protein